MSALDDLLPVFDWRERHERRLDVAPDRAVAAMLATLAAPDLLVQALLRFRGLAGSSTIADLFVALGFETLHESQTDVVVGAVGTPWRPGGGMSPFAEVRPGTVRVAADIRAVPAGSGCLLSTETRIQAMDDGARGAFRRYWLVVRPFSGLIRRRWLAAAARSLEHE